MTEYDKLSAGQEVAQRVITHVGAILADAQTGGG